MISGLLSFVFADDESYATLQCSPVSKDKDVNRM